MTNKKIILYDEKLKKISKNSKYTHDKQYHNNSVNEYFEDVINIDNSSIASPPIGVMENFAKGSFQFNMNWTDMIKFAKTYSLINEYTNKYKIIPNVLDLGCKHCDIRYICYRNRLPINYFGVDIDTTTLKKHYKNFTNKNNFFYATNFSKSLSLDKFNTKFDFILLFDIIEHLDNKEDGLKLIKNSMKYLKNDGCIIISTPNSYEDNKLQYPNDHKYEYSLNELKTFISNNSLQIVELYGSNILERHLKNIPQDKKNKLNLGMFSTILGLRNAYIGTELPEYCRHVYMVCKKNDK